MAVEAGPGRLHLVVNLDIVPVERPEEIWIDPIHPRP
jgi:hypothetical protein